jgi:hypothetical protein
MAVGRFCLLNRLKVLDTHSRYVSVCCCRTRRGGLRDSGGAMWLIHKRETGHTVGENCTMSVSI